MDGKQMMIDNLRMDMRALQEENLRLRDENAALIGINRALVSEKQEALLEVVRVRNGVAAVSRTLEAWRVGEGRIADDLRALLAGEETTDGT